MKTTLLYNPYYIFKKTQICKTLVHSNVKKRFINETLTKILTRLSTDKKFTLLHESIAEMFKYRNVLESGAFEEENCMINCNQIIINNKYYLNHRKYEDIYDQYMVELSNVKNSTLGKPDVLVNALKQSEELIKRDADRVGLKYHNIYKSLYEYKTFNSFIHDYFHFTVSLAHKTHYTFKLTSFAIQLTEYIFEFIMVQYPTLNNIFKYFSYETSLEISKHEERSMLDFIKTICEVSLNDQKAISAIFEPLDIMNRHIQHQLCCYIRYLLFHNYKKNTIYKDKLKEFINNHIKTYDVNAEINVQREEKVKIAYYYIQVLESCGCFTTELKNVKGTRAKFITPTQPLIDFLLSNKTYQRPYLYRTQKKKILLQPKEVYGQIFIRNMGKIVHDNPRINIKIHETSYRHKNPAEIYVSIDQDYLTEFLTLLDDGLKEEYIWTLYNIRKSKIDELRKIDNKLLTNTIDYILIQCSTFEESMTVNMVKKRVKKMIHEAKEFEESDVVSTYSNYIPIISQLIEKIFVRKQALVTLLQDSILYCMLKYIIFTGYLDTRGRAYLSASSLNIFTNPQAKCFIKLYNQSINPAPTLEDLTIIKEGLKFTQTQNQIEMKDLDVNKDKNTQYIYKYIRSYLNVSEHYVNDLIRKQGMLYVDDTALLLSEIQSKIKKAKHLFYVHSLIRYEQLRHLGKHNKLIFNYVQLDASSSGLQMLSILFRNKELARFANLRGNENYDVYTQATNNCKIIMVKFHHFTFEAMKLFGCREMLTEQLDLSIKVYDMMPDISNCEIKDRISKVLSLFFTMQLGTSSITHSLLIELITYINDNKTLFETNIKERSTIIDYLSSTHKKLLANLSNLIKFKKDKDILEYLFCLRYSSRLTNLVKFHLKINYFEKDNKFFNRDMTKNHVMTLMYMSTPYSRRESYMEIIEEFHLLSKLKRSFIHEFADFLEKTTSKFISQTTPLSMINYFVDDICHDKAIIIKNRNFTIIMDPRRTKAFQVACASYHKKRGPQLVIRKPLKEVNNKKLKSMFLANLAHSLDSDLMHHFCEICLHINKALIKAKSKFRLVYETNHDCFILNYVPLTKIIVEEAYLRLCSQNNLEYLSELSYKTIETIDPQSLQVKKETIEIITPISKDLVSKYVEQSCHDFLLSLNPINPNFMK